MCHNTAFDFNDNVSPIAATFFVRLVEGRLGVALYDEAELPMPLLAEDEDTAGATKRADEASGPGAGPISLQPPSKKARK